MSPLNQTLTCFNCLLSPKKKKKFNQKHKHLLFKHLLFFPIRQTFQVNLQREIESNMVWENFLLTHLKLRVQNTLNTKKQVTCFTSANHAVNSGRLFLQNIGDHKQKEKWKRGHLFTRCGVFLVFFYYFCFKRANSYLGE